MYVDVTVPRDENLPLFFNVDAHVGAGCPNHQDDVLLVQFLCRLVAKSPRTGAETKAACSIVPLTGICEEKTVAAIRRVQESAKGTVDGRVSPIRNGKTSYGSGIFVLALLTHRARESCAPWPRLQDMPNCPGKLQDAVIAALGCVISTRTL